MKKRELFKKLTAMTAVTAMCLSMVACGGSDSSSTATDGSTEAATEETAEASTEESGDAAETEVSGDPIEISIAVWNADEAFSQEDEVLQTIEDKLNIKITPVNVTWDDYTEKVQLWAASGSLPDVFIGAQRTTSTYPQWADQGIIHAIPDDLSAYPTLQEYLSGDAAQEAKINDVLYCLPRQTYPSQNWTANDRLILYRWDLAQKAGITKEPETWDEFITMMEAIMEADPDGTSIGGMTTVTPSLLAGVIMPYASPIVMDTGSIFKWELDESDGLYKPAFCLEDMTAGYQLARDMYESGVIEQDIVLVSGDQGKDKFLQGKAAAIVCSGGFTNLYSTVARYWSDVHNGDDYMDDVKALNLMPDVNGNLSYFATASYAWSESYINANVSDEKLDAILRLWDYLLTDEGSFLVNYGPEGVLYDFDENGNVVMKDENAVVGDTYPSTNGLATLARWNPSSYDSRYVAVAPAAYTEVDVDRAEQAATVELPEYNTACTEQVMKQGITFTFDGDNDFLTIMTGDEPVEDMWNEILEGYEADGLSDMIQKVNEGLQSN